MRKILFIFVFLLGFTFSLNTQAVSDTKLGTFDINTSAESFETRSVLENQLGENITDALINEILEKVNKYTTITIEKIRDIVLDVTTEYGVELSETQIQELITELSGNIVAKIIEQEQYTLWERICMAYEHVQNLVEETFPEVKDKEIIVEIPRISQIDNLVDQAIYYFRENILPIILG